MSLGPILSHKNPAQVLSGFCTSQTLGCSGRKLVTLPNKFSCSLISHNSAEPNPSSNGNLKWLILLLNLLQTICMSWLLSEHPIKAKVSLNCLVRESQAQALSSFWMSPRGCSHTQLAFHPANTFFFFFIKVSLPVLIYFLDTESRHDRNLAS